MKQWKWKKNFGCPSTALCVCVCVWVARHFLFSDTVSQHCSTVAKGWISLNVRLFEREREREGDHE